MLFWLYLAVESIEGIERSPLTKVEGPVEKDAKAPSVICPRLGILLMIKRKGGCKIA